MNSVYLDLYNHLKNWKKNLVICEELDDHILHNHRFVNKEITNEELIKDISNQFYQHTLTNEFQHLINQQIKLKLNETLDFSQIPKIINDLLQKKIEKWKKNEENDSDLDKLVLTCKIDEKTILNEIKKKNDLFVLLPVWKLKINSLLKKMTQLSGESKIEENQTQENPRKRKENPVKESNALKINNS